MKKITYTALFIVLSFSPMSYAQEVASNIEESAIVLSEDDITSLTNKLRKYKESKKQRIADQSVNRTVITSDSDFESRFLRQEIAQLEGLLKMELSKTQPSPTNSVTNDGELKTASIDTLGLKERIERLEENFNGTNSAIVKAKKVENPDLESERLRLKIEQLEKSLNQEQTKNKSNSAELASRDRELSRMRDDIDDLKGNVKSRPRDRNRTNLVVAPIPTGGNNDKNRAQPVQKDSTFIKEFSNLNSKMDSLYAFAKAEKQQQLAIVPQGEINAQDEEALKEVQLLLAELKKELAIAKSTSSDYDALYVKFKSYNKAIYFANNATSVNAEGSQAVEELYGLLNENRNLDVVVKGFASNKGNASYNEKLSMQRTESIKRALVQRGVHPTRVLTQYHGIDYNATSAETARRVEITMLVRK